MNQKCVIGLIPVKSYQKGLVFFVAKTLVDMTNSMLNMFLVNK